ncbi:hypothetical protein HBB16_15650 [Pseudonocardia sp. MCCB 268]|nr:hypothetical protein [Pseudonocardia cytotoxica]
MLAFRDPYLVEAHGARWGLIGAGHAGGGRPDVLVYHVDRLDEWLRRLAARRQRPSRRAPGRTGRRLECPALLPAGDGRWVLVLSLWVDDITYTTVALTGTLDHGEGLRFRPDGGGGLLDHGRDHYAATALVERDRTPGVGLELGVPLPAASADAGWAAARPSRGWARTTTARLRIVAARELVAFARSPLDPGAELPQAYELELRATAVPETQVELRLGPSVVVRATPSRDLVELDRSAVPAESSRPPVPRPGSVTAAVPASTLVQLRVLVRRRSSEIYVNDRAALTEKVYPRRRAPRKCPCRAATPRWAARLGPRRRRRQHRRDQSPPPDPPRTPGPRARTPHDHRSTGHPRPQLTVTEGMVSG